MYKYLVVLKADNPHGIRNTIEIPSHQYDANDAGVWDERNKTAVFYPWHRVHEVRMVEV